jgi:ABC-type Mn2+/Zn2+ transport system ATPase subunit
MATPVTSFSAQATSPSQTGQSPIQIHQHVSVQIEHKRIIENLSFELAPGEIKRSWTNGAGRTILLRALLRLVPYSGEISGVPDVRIGYVPHRNSKLIDTSL